MPPPSPKLCRCQCDSSRAIVYRHKLGQAKFKTDLLQWFLCISLTGMYLIKINKKELNLGKVMGTMICMLWLLLQNAVPPGLSPAPVWGGWAQGFWSGRAKPRPIVGGLGRDSVLAWLSPALLLSSFPFLRPEVSCSWWKHSSCVPAGTLPLHCAHWKGGAPVQGLGQRGWEAEGREGFTGAAWAGRLACLGFRPSEMGRCCQESDPVRHKHMLRAKLTAPHPHPATIACFLPRFFAILDVAFNLRSINRTQTAFPLAEGGVCTPFLESDPHPTRASPHTSQSRRSRSERPQVTHEYLMKPQAD